MADTKITALTAITTVDPAVDVLPIVDISDTTMAASGTTKKITSNQILGAGGTATLASATITGDLTVDTNTLKVVSSLDFVGIGATTQSFGEKFRINGNYTVMNDGTFTGFLGKASAIGASGATSDFGIRSENNLLFLTNGANLQMTLNSTGLGVGASPGQKLDVVSSTGCVARIRGGSGSGQSAAFYVSNTAGTSTLAAFGDGANMIGGTVDSSAMVYAGASIPLVFYVNSAERMRIDSSGNVGVGVTPSTVWTANGNLQVGVHAALYTNASLGATDFAYNSIRTGSDTYQYSFATSLAASRLQQRDGSFRFFTAPAGTSPNAITFTERLRLKETGQLRFVPLAADPAGAEAGDVYYNSSSNKLKCYNGTTWNDLF
jgi:hypothetical protein